MEIVQNNLYFYEHVQSYFLVKGNVYITLLAPAFDNVKYFFFFFKECHKSREYGYENKVT